MRRLGVAAAAAYAALGGLVASGALTGVDQWASTHAMPLTGPMRTSGPTLLESVVPLLHDSLQPIGFAVALIVTLPGQFLVSLLLILVAGRKLRSRGRRDAAVGWIVAWILASGVEVVCRSSITRPPLRRGEPWAVAFHDSWPSGHAMRGALVVCALAAAWPHLRGVFAAWLAAAAVLLELAAFHTPTDVLGGLLLAAAFAAGAVELERSGLLRRRAALRRSGARAAG